MGVKWSFFRRQHILDTMGCVAQGCFEGVLRGGEVRYWGWISDRLQVCEGRVLLVVDL